jgi:hypothetical protein
MSLTTGQYFQPEAIVEPRNLLDVFLLVLVRHFNVPSALLQVNNHLLSESLIVNREGRVDDIGNVILHGPCECAVELSINTFHVGKGDPLLQDHLVESTDKECVQEASVENGQTNDTTDELEVTKMLGVDAGMWVNLECVVVVCRVLEQAVEGVEHLV